MIPTGVAMVKSGCNASVVGEPVHAAGLISNPSASATDDGRRRFDPVIRTDAMARAITDAVDLVGTDIMFARSPWRRNRLRYAARYEERARAVTVVHKKALSAAARDCGGFH